MKNFTYFRPTTPEQAVTLLAQDLLPVVKKVSRLIKVPLTANQLAALTSLVVNSGRAPLNGTLGRVLNQGEYERVPAEMMKWVYAGNHVLPGLVRRRKAEIAIWNKK